LRDHVKGVASSKELSARGEVASDRSGLLKSAVEHGKKKFVRNIGEKSSQQEADEGGDDTNWVQGQKGPGKRGG